MRQLQPVVGGVSRKTCGHNYLVVLPMCFKSSTEGCFSVLKLIYGSRRRRLKHMTLERLVLLKIFLREMTVEETMLFCRCVASRFEGSGAVPESFETTQDMIDALAALWAGSEREVDVEEGDEEDVIVRRARQRVG